MDKPNPTRPRGTGTRKIKKSRIYTILATATWTANVPLFFRAKEGMHNRVGATSSYGSSSLTEKARKNTSINRKMEEIT